MGEKILECKNLRKSFGKKEILKGVSLEMTSGDILGFIGPNGAGKTTTIKLILGLQKITSGTVKINGYDIEKNFEKAISEVGAIVESPDLYMYMSGYDNLKMISKLYKNIDENRIQEVIKLVGLTNRINDNVSKYSLGMRQRLGIAQAILHRPKLLILDEPTNGLDPEGIKQVKDLIVELAEKEGMSVLISSHNLAELESFCNKITIIQNGEVIESTTMQQAKQINENEKVPYIIEAEDAAKVEKILKDVTKEGKTTIKLSAKKNEIPDIIKQLVENDIKIYEIYQEEISLEDAFLKKTGGNVIE